MKKAAKRSEALKSNFEADVCNSQFVCAKQLFRSLDASFYEVLVWSRVEGLPEESQKMVTRKAGFFGNLFEAQRMVITMVDKIARAPESLERLEILQASRSTFMTIGNPEGGVSTDYSDYAD